MFTFEFDHFDRLTQLYSEWRQISKLVNFQDFCYGPGMRARSKFDNDWNFLILLHSSRKHLKTIFTFEFDHLDWLSQFYSEWKQTSKLVNFQDFCYGRGLNLIMTETYWFCSIHQKNTCKSFLYFNLINFTDLDSFTGMKTKFEIRQGRFLLRSGYAM